MTVSRDELVMIKVGLLRDMDKYMRENLHDDLMLDRWFRAGISDKATEDDYTRIAEDEELWLDVVIEFSELCQYKANE